MEHGLLLENLLDLAHAPFAHASAPAEGWPAPEAVRSAAARLLGGEWRPLETSFEPPCMVASRAGLAQPGSIQRVRPRGGGEEGERARAAGRGLQGWGAPLPTRRLLARPGRGTGAEPLTRRRPCCRPPGRGCRELRQPPAPAARLPACAARPHPPALPPVLRLPGVDAVRPRGRGPLAVRRGTGGGGGPRPAAQGGAAGPPGDARRRRRRLGAPAALRPARGAVPALEKRGGGRRRRRRGRGRRRAHVSGGAVEYRRRGAGGRRGRRPGLTALPERCRPLLAGALPSLSPLSLSSLLPSSLYYTEDLQKSRHTHQICACWASSGAAQQGGLLKRGDHSHPASKTRFAKYQSADRTLHSSSLLTHCCLPRSQESWSRTHHMGLLDRLRGKGKEDAAEASDVGAPGSAAAAAAVSPTLDLSESAPVASGRPADGARPLGMPSFEESTRLYNPYEGAIGAAPPPDARLAAAPGLRRHGGGMPAAPSALSLRRAQPPPPPPPSTPPLRAGRGPGQAGGAGRVQGAAAAGVSV